MLSVWDVAFSIWKKRNPRRLHSASGMFPTLYTLRGKLIIYIHYAFLFRKFSRVSQSVHIHYLCCAGSIQASFFRFLSRIFFVISVLHLTQLGNKQPWHKYLLLSLKPESSFAFKAVTFCLQSVDLHVESRQILQVVHAGLLHGGFKQSKHLIALRPLRLLIQSSGTIFLQSLHLIKERHEFIFSLHAEQT